MFRDMFEEPKRVLEFKNSTNRDMIMAFIEATIARTGKSPTIRQICQATGLTSTDSVHAHIVELEEEGYLTKLPFRGTVGNRLRLTNKRYFS